MVQGAWIITEPLPTLSLLSLSVSSQVPASSSNCSYVPDYALCMLRTSVLISHPFVRKSWNGRNRDSSELTYICITFESVDERRQAP